MTDLAPLVEEFARHHDDPVSPGLVSRHSLAAPAVPHRQGHLLLQPRRPVTSDNGGVTRHTFLYNLEMKEPADIS